jgi:DNA-binding GntR family transcriptional regulator
MCPLELTTTATGENRLAEAMAVHETSAQARFADRVTEEELGLLERITRKLRDDNRSGRLNPSGRVPAHSHGRLTSPSGPSHYWLTSWSRRVRARSTLARMDSAVAVQT